jgi:hypothetical protein
VAPSQPGEVPPLALHVASGVPTLVQLEAPLTPGTPRLPEGEARIQLLPAGGGAWVLIPSSTLAEGEQVPLTVDTGPGSTPLRFALVSQRGEADVQVRVVRAAPSAEEDALESLAHHLLATPEARVLHAIPREAVDLQFGLSRARVDSVLWLGRRLLATVAVRDGKEGAPPWRLVQVRLRARLANGVWLEWPARLFPGRSGARRRPHMFTSLLPEGASRLELALDGEDAPGGFQPLPGGKAPVLP